LEQLGLRFEIGAASSEDNLAFDQNDIAIGEQGAGGEKACLSQEFTAPECHALRPSMRYCFDKNCGVFKHAA
jgi:hypothetical protein